MQIQSVGIDLGKTTSVDLALGTAMDISAGQRGDAVRVEDVLPSCRLPRIVDALKRRTWNLNMADAGNCRELYVELPRSLGMRSIPRFYQSMAEVEFS